MPGLLQTRDQGGWSFAPHLRAGELQEGFWAPPGWRHHDSSMVAKVCQSYHSPSDPKRPRGNSHSNPSIGFSNRTRNPQNHGDTKQFSYPSLLFQRSEIWCPVEINKVTLTFSSFGWLINYTLTFAEEWKPISMSLTLSGDTRSSTLFSFPAKINYNDRVKQNVAPGFKSRRIADIKPKTIVRKWTRRCLQNVWRKGINVDNIINFSPLIILIIAQVKIR